jgi:hypothetical protein
MGLLACFAIWRFHAASFRIAGEGLDAAVTPATDAINRWVARARSKVGLGERA